MKTNVLKKKWIVVLFINALFFSFSTNLLAWSEHPLITYPVAASLTEVRDAQPVKAEPIEAFINAEAKTWRFFWHRKKSGRKKICSGMRLCLTP